MNIEEANNKAQDAINEVLNNEKNVIGELSTGMVDFSSPEGHLSDNEWEKVLAMMNQGAKKAGYNSVNEQVKKITDDSKQLDPFAEMKIMSNSNSEFSKYMNETRNKQEFD